MKYICTICGYVYDEEKGKVPFKSLPDDWKCPICGAPKSAFKPEEQSASSTKEKVYLDYQEEELTKLTNGQLAAVFYNIARGFEKQYNTDGQKAAKEIAEYFENKTEDVDLNSFEDLEELIKDDIDNKYLLTNAIAKENGDRGTQRICVWGEKVTRMLSSLIEQYKEEGENFLKGTNVWVCTVCGFVYIGDKAPELCPVCKVPSYKFEKIEGRE